MTLIRRMHSLRRGEGRVGWLSNGKYMHWLQDELGLESRWGWRLCPRAALLSETGQGWAWKGGEVPMKLSLRDHVSVFAIYSMGGLLPEKKKRKKWRKETEIYREKPPPPPPPPVWMARYFQRQDAKYIKWHSQKPPTRPRESQGRNAFLNPDFLSTSWHWLQDARPVGMRAARAGATSPGDLQVPLGGLSATPLRGGGPLLTGLSQ